MKTRDLVGIQLDWAVAKYEGTLPTSYDDWQQCWPKYSSEWQVGGPVIERRKISLEVDHSAVPIAYDKYNYADERRYMSSGSTYLVAAMRCIVMRGLGDEVDIPKELM